MLNKEYFMRLLEQMDDAKADIQSVWDEYEASNKERDNVSKELFRIQKQLQEARAELESESELRHVAEAELVEAKVLIDELRESCKELESDRDHHLMEHARLRQDNDVLDERNAILELSISKANKTISELTDKLSTAQSKHKFSLKPILRNINPFTTAATLFIIGIASVPGWLYYIGEAPIGGMIGGYIFLAWLAWLYWCINHD